MTKDFDPWTSNVDEAVEAQQEFERTMTYGQRKLPIEKQPFFVFEGAQHIKELRAVIEASGRDSGFAILEAIMECARFGFKMPEWLAKEYMRRYARVMAYRTNSWDEVFGKPYPGKHLKDLRVRRESSFAVWREISVILSKEPETSINRKLFQKVADKLKIGARIVEELYKELKKESMFPEKGTMLEIGQEDVTDAVATMLKDRLVLRDPDSDDTVK